MFGKLSYPKTRVVDVADDYFGTRVPDPYRWLEDEADPEVVAWTNAQHDFAMEMLSGLAGRETFERRLREVWDYPKHDIPRERGGRLFYLRNDGLLNQPKLYVREADGAERVLIDPNALSDDGTIAIFDWKPTADGRLLLYALSESGMDWLTFRVLDVETGDDLPDTITNIKFSVPAWRPDGSGFYYSRFEDNARDEGDDNQAVSQLLYLHRLGADQADDELVYAHPDIRGVTLSAEVSSDGRYLILYVHRESKLANRMYYRELDGDGDFVRLFDDLDAEYAFIGNDGDTFYVRTTNGRAQSTGDRGRYHESGARELAGCRAGNARKHGGRGFRESAICGHDHARCPSRRQDLPQRWNPGSRTAAAGHGLDAFARRRLWQAR